MTFRAGIYSDRGVAQQVMIETHLVLKGCPGESKIVNRVSISAINASQHENSNVIRVFKIEYESIPEELNEKYRLGKRGAVDVSVIRIVRRAIGVIDLTADPDSPKRSKSGHFWALKWAPTRATALHWALPN